MKYISSLICSRRLNRPAAFKREYRIQPKPSFLLLVCLILLAVLANCKTASLGQKPQSSITYDFENGVPAEWSTNGVYDMDGTKVLGLFNDRNKKFERSTQLRLSDIPADSFITLAFDLYLIGTWDSSGKLSDRWQVSIPGGPTLLELTVFPNRFKDPDEKMPDGNAGLVEIYGHLRPYWIQHYRITLTPAQISQNTLTLLFRGYLTGRKTEFWALDNMTVTAGEAK